MSISRLAKTIFKSLAQPLIMSVENNNWLLSFDQRLCFNWISQNEVT